MVPLFLVYFVIILLQKTILDNHPNVIFGSYNYKIVDIIMALGVKQLFQNLKSYIFE